MPGTFFERPEGKLNEERFEGRDMAVGTEAAGEGGACAVVQRREVEHIRLHSKKMVLGRVTSCPEWLAHPRGQGYRQEEGQRSRVTGWAEQGARPPGSVSLCLAGWARRGPEGRGGSVTPENRLVSLPTLWPWCPFACHDSLLSPN